MAITLQAKPYLHTWRKNIQDILEYIGPEQQYFMSTIKRES